MCIMCKCRVWSVEWVNLVGRSSMGLSTTWRTLCAQCVVSPVRTGIMLALNVPQKWPSDTECNGLVMLFVCMGKTRFGA